MRRLGAWSWARKRTLRAAVSGCVVGWWRFVDIYEFMCSISLYGGTCCEQRSAIAIT